MREEARAHGLLLTPAADAEILAAEIVSDHLHDELARRGTVADWVARRFWKGLNAVHGGIRQRATTAEECFRMSPAGPRVVGDSTRGGQVAVHVSAQPCYGHGPPQVPVPWSGLDVRFVGTVPSAVPIPEATCDCHQE